MTELAGKAAYDGPVASGDAPQEAWLPAGAVVCYAKCWPCSTQQCPGGEHRWADSEDVEHAVKIGKPESAEGICGCPCARGPVLVAEPPDLDEWPGSLAAPPCPVCGELGACSYDAEGRPLIHTFTEEDE